MSGRLIAYCSTAKIILILRRDLYAVYPDAVDRGIRCQSCDRQESTTITMLSRIANSFFFITVPPFLNCLLGSFFATDIPRKDMFTGGS